MEGHVREHASRKANVSRNAVAIKKHCKAICRLLCNAFLARYKGLRLDVDFILKSFANIVVEESDFN